MFNRFLKNSQLLWVESDSLNVIFNPSKIPWRFRQFLVQIESLQKVITNWRVTHICREAKYEGDELAKQCFKGGGSFTILCIKGVRLQFVRCLLLVWLLAVFNCGWSQ